MATQVQSKHWRVVRRGGKAFVQRFRAKKDIGVVGVVRAAKARAGAAPAGGAAEGAAGAGAPAGPKRKLHPHQRTERQLAKFETRIKRARARIDTRMEARMAKAEARHTGKGGMYERVERRVNAAHAKLKAKHERLLAQHSNRITKAHAAIANAKTDAARQRHIAKRDELEARSARMLAAGKERAANEHRRAMERESGKLSRSRERMGMARIRAAGDAGEAVIQLDARATAGRAKLQAKLAAQRAKYDAGRAAEAARRQRANEKQARREENKRIDRRAAKERAIAARKEREARKAAAGGQSMRQQPEYAQPLSGAAVHNAHPTHPPADYPPPGGRLSPRGTNSARVFMADSLRGAVRPELATTMDEAHRAIDKVHRMPEGMQIVGVNSKVISSRAFAEYTTGMAASAVPFPVIGVRTAHRETTDSAFSYTHEIGHAIDNHLGARGDRGHGGDTRFSSNRTHDSHMVALMDAIRSTPETTTILAAGRGSRAKAFDKYAARPHEIFARAYSQYIAHKTGHAGMIRAAQDMRRGPDNNHQWSHESMSKIVPAFDAFFRAHGLLVED